jgi:prepilin peptidase dependent protein B
MLKRLGFHAAGRARHGLSLVEMMVGIALGMILVAGAATLFVTHLTNGRRLLLEARLEQDMRAAADLITRDLRRAGYWGNALTGTVATGPGSTTASNPYRLVTTGAGTVGYSFTRDGAVDNNALDNNEQFGFDLNGGVIRMQLAVGSVQPVTDIDTLTIDTFTVLPTVTPVDVRDSCAKFCCDAPGVAAGVCANPQINVTAPATCPTVTVRQYLVTLAGHATRDAAVTRTLQTRVRTRNDLLGGTCPA